MARRRGCLIAIEGIDQAGKRTQARLLAAEIRRRGVPVFAWSFPDYRTHIGKLLRTYLQARVSLDMRALHMLYAANRWEVASKLRRALWDSVIIVNRYSPSNLAYGLAHGLPANWLFSLEEGLPKTDLVIILDIPARMSTDRKSKHRDVHEADIAYLRRVRREYLRLAEEFGWRIVNGGLDQSAVRESVWRMVAPLIRR